MVAWWTKDADDKPDPEQGIGFGKSTAPDRYRILRQRMITLMVLVSVIPLLGMAVVNHYAYQKAVKGEVIQPIKSLLNKTRTSFELFLAERRSAVSFIARAYTFEQLADQDALGRIFRVMKEEFGGFVDLGLIDITGEQVSYTGPYQLQGKNYAEQDWFQECQIKGVHISDVFMGYRKFPHLVIAVHHAALSGESWILRATIDTDTFTDIILTTGLEMENDTFLINRNGVLQTPSKFYGDVLKTLPMPIPPISYEPAVTEIVDPKGRELLMGYTYISSPPFILATMKPKTEVLKAWYTLEGELFIFLAIGVFLILITAFRVTGLLVKRIEKSDQERAMVYHEIEYTNKLASIGRLAAGVAHEINNPVAIINEKAGLLKDLTVFDPDFPGKEKIQPHVDSILNSVERVRAITHRLLGFAKRMEVAYEVLDVNEVIKEVMGFLEKEALHRNIEVKLNLDEDLPKISSDHGQLQQVFLNILNNAFGAVESEGRVVVTSFEKDLDTVGVSFSDNGIGISKETIDHIFEPFFTTKKGRGTGLGLSITYGIVKSMGGEIEVSGKEGQGATFTVFLPKKAKPTGGQKDAKYKSLIG